MPKSIRLNSTHYVTIKISNKQELWQIVFSHSSDIDFGNFMNLYQKRVSKTHSFLVVDATLASDNSSRSRKNLLKNIYKLIMTTDDQIKDEKSQHNINRKAAKISALSSRTTDKYESYS